MYDNMSAECSIEYCSRCVNTSVSQLCENCIKDPTQQDCKICRSWERSHGKSILDKLDWRCEQCEPEYTASEDGKACICEWS